MIPSKITNLKTLLSTGNKIDENFVYFIAFLYSISTGEIGAVELFKSGKDSKYGKYSEAFRDAYRLGVGWSYGLASACEAIAVKVSDKKDDPMKLLLVKLSQVIILGDDLKSFFKDELKNAVQTYSIKYEANLESQKLFSEMFYTLMSTASFMISANSIMSMLMGFGDAEQILIISMMGTGGGMAVFVMMMFFMFPRDTLAHTDADIEKKFRMKIYLALGASIGISLVLIISGAIPLVLAVALGGIPLLYPGIIAKKSESRITSYNDWYPTFILHFGQLYSTVGAMGQALQAVMRSNFGSIHFFASTGIRPAGIDDPILCLKHLENMPNGYFAVKIYDGSRENYWTFLTQEASKSLKHYLNSRKLNGEELGDDSPIFANSIKSNTKSQDHLSSKSARQIIFNILQNSGISRTKKGNRYDKATLYGFRKRFNTVLKINNDVNSNIAEKLMAHKNGLDGNYLKPTREQCFTEFLKAVETLTISDKYRDQIKITKLQQEKTDVGTLQSQMNDMQIMQKSLADMIVSLGKDKSRRILSKNTDVKKFIDVIEDSDAILIKNPDGSDTYY